MVKRKTNVSSSAYQIVSDNRYIIICEHMLQQGNSCFFADWTKMRQLKGKVKETARERKQRKKEFAETQKQVYTIAIPTVIAVFLFIAVYVYLKTRPKNHFD